MPPLLVTAAIIRRQDKILITRRPEGSKYAGLWEFPGGKLETGESPEQCLQREIREELGVKVAVDAVFDAIFHRYAWGDVLLLAYNCRLQNQSIRNLGVAEHRWVTVETLSEFSLLPADAPIVYKLQNNVSRPA
ncbi:MAG: (deoxy)nucleoside triphosphate pyrophosphohydrolase [Desulfuromonadales bacterium]|jgi:8-oxo-dGTP diphosphatase|nr:(deoxy)nucleoside triphosphate pyrophosphohydrolase [Desulfuromonadales bacterium]